MSSQKKSWVIDPQYITPHSMSVCLKDRIFTETKGDSYNIVDPASGMLVFQINGTIFTLHHKKALCDAAGNEILFIKSKMVSLHNTHFIYSSKGDVLAKIKFKQLFHHHGGYQDMEIKTINGQTFSLSGNISAKTFCIKNSMHLDVATVYREAERSMSKNIESHHKTASNSCNSGSNVLQSIEHGASSSTYFLSVQSGVDLAFMVAVCICVDELLYDKS
jgi:uncharacterized protein YxjI